MFVVLAFLMHAGLSFAQDPVLTWVEKGDLVNLEEYLQDHDINAGTVEPVTTLLVHSIMHGNVITTEWLIERGADVDQFVDGMSPLMYAAGTDDLKTVKALIEANADIEVRDPEGSTALFYAATHGNLKITKYLVRHDADLTHKNIRWESAYDMAVHNSNQEVATFLRNSYERNLPDLQDGPYIKWNSKKMIKAFYIVHESKSQITRKSRSKFKADSDPFLMKGFSGDPRKYILDHRSEVLPYKMVQVDRVLVIGDIHGGFDSLVVFLQQNGIMNNSFEWTWGDGHLVFVGDIFDRGDQVTEALWLIYQLEKQAGEKGGAVHLILGNHEIMVLSGNINYVSDKYQLLSSKLNIDYSMLFGKRTVLGQWLRTKNTIIRINGHLFVHAGLSPVILESGLGIHEINENVRYFLNHPDREHYGEVDRDMLMGHNGPFWYRGYMEDNHFYKHLPEDDFERVLEHFNAGYIFVGHTNVKQITSLYNNRVFALDVPFYTYGFPIQGLLLENETVYLLNSSGEKKQFR